MRLDEKMRRSVASGAQERAETKEKLPKSFLAIVYASCGFLGVVWLLLNDWQNDFTNQAGDSKSASSGGESASSPQISIDFSSIIGIRDSQWYQPVKDYLLGWEPWLASLFIFFLVMFIILTVFNIINQFTLPKEKRYGVFENNWAGWGIIGVIIISFVVAISHHSAGDVGKHGVEDGDIKTSLKSEIKPINLRGKKYGEYETIIMGPYDIVEVTIPTLPHRETQFTHTTCAEIVGPPLLVGSSYMPKIHLVYQNPKYGYVHNMILSKKMKELMAEWEQGYVEVRFTLTRIPMSTTPDSGCTHTKVNDN